ncbi:MAG: pyridoxamine 5'-phosphate oxidase family protein [Candidatus Dormibacteria bacterium]
MTEHETAVAPSHRVTAGRHADRAHYDKGVIHDILDAGAICHLGVVRDGAPLVVPTSYGRVGDVVYLHGARANRSLELAGDAQICVTVTLVDGLVLARSAFGHSLNYRSVVILGAGHRVDSIEEKRAALRSFVEHVLPGRSHEIRQPSAAELAATTVLRLNIAEASAKVRTGPPIDAAIDRETDTWAGEVPLRTVSGEPLVAPFLDATRALPESVVGYLERHR